MKILIVAHRFPPRHQTGAELYSWRLAKALLERGHEITVFTADDDLLKRNYARVVRPMGRLRVIEVQNHRLHETFAETYADPHMEREFRDVLFEVGPNIVHFQHLLHHSVHYPAMARELEIPSILTLHEYWFLCGRNGQLLQANGDRCLGPGNEKCARCLSTFMWGRRNLDLWMLRGLAGVRRLTGVDLKAQARKIRLKRLSEIDPAHVSIEAIAEMKKDLLIREARVRDMFDMVDCFLAPSEFLKERFVQYGLESERILHNDYGTELEAFDRPRVPPKPNGRIRVGFIGSIQPVKGVHLLVQAMQDLDPVRFEARIWGDLSTKPEYVAALRRQLPSHVRLAGGVPQEAISGILADLDVLVVPSVWWENSPLVIHEAFAAGVPVVCSGIGGMAELVADGVSGLHFQPADVASLAAALRRLVDEPELLDRLRAGIPTLDDIESDARFHEQLFEAVMSHHAELEEPGEESEIDFEG